VIGLLALGAWAQGDAYRRDRGRPRRRVQAGWPHPGSAFSDVIAAREKATT